MHVKHPDTLRVLASLSDEQVTILSSFPVPPRKMRISFWGWSFLFMLARHGPRVPLSPFIVRQVF